MVVRYTVHDIDINFPSLFPFPGLFIFTGFIQEFIFYLILGFPLSGVFTFFVVFTSPN